MILNINKPIGWTSYDVVRKVKSTLNIKKVGHAGTLDPLAEGVLLVLTDKDTKKQQEFMAMDKEYVFEMVLGVTSVTYDMEGPLTLKEDVTKLPEDVFSADNLSKILKKYTGTIKQKVPPYSAVKHKGKAFYKYARSGKMGDIALPVKEVNIYGIELLEITPKKEILIMGKSLLLPHIKAKVLCGKGTYIRSLAHDIGQDLGIGATVTSLVRTRIGVYKIEDAVSIESISEFIKD